MLSFYRQFWQMLNWMPPAFQTFIAAMFAYTVCAAFLKIFMGIVHFVRGR